MPEDARAIAGVATDGADPFVLTLALTLPADGRRTRTGGSAVTCELSFAFVARGVVAPDLVVWVVAFEIGTVLTEAGGPARDANTWKMG
jgi:hypothetical protein